MQITKAQKFKAKSCVFGTFELKVNMVINIAIYWYIEALRIEIASTSKF